MVSIQKSLTLLVRRVTICSKNTTKSVAPENSEKFKISRAILEGVRVEKRAPFLGSAGDPPAFTLRVHPQQP